MELSVIINLLYVSSKLVKIESQKTEKFCANPVIPCSFMSQEPSDSSQPTEAVGAIEYKPSSSSTCTSQSLSLDQLGPMVINSVDFKF